MTNPLTEALRALKLARFIIQKLLWLQEEYSVGVNEAEKADLKQIDLAIETLEKELYEHNQKGHKK